MERNERRIVLKWNFGRYREISDFSKQARILIRLQLSSHCHPFCFLKKALTTKTLINARFWHNLKS